MRKRQGMSEADFPPAAPAASNCERPGAESGTSGCLLVGWQLLTDISDHKHGARLAARTLMFAERCAQVRHLLRHK